MINFEFNFWDNLFAGIGKEIENIKIYSKVVLADVKKYHPSRTDLTNSRYYKQGAEMYLLVPEHGVQFILRPTEEGIPVATVPFEWIEYVRDSDSEDNRLIIVCKFEGVKWYKRFKSPFKDVGFIYENKNYREGRDPEFLKYTNIKPTVDNKA